MQMYLLSKDEEKIDYSSVHCMPTVKLSGQTQGTTTNTMPTSTSLQDISSHAQKFTWNNNANDNTNDQRIKTYSKKTVPTNDSFRLLNVSQSDERIFEHPEVTIKPSELDDQIQRRMITMKTSNTKENLLDNADAQCESNILEHPDMRSPVVMQTIPSSTSSSALLFQDDCRRASRTQPIELNSTTIRRTSPPATNNHRVEFFIDNQSNTKRSLSPSSLIDHIHENSEQQQQQQKEHPQLSSNSTHSLSKPNNSW